MARTVTPTSPSRRVPHRPAHPRRRRRCAVRLVGEPADRRRRAAPSTSSPAIARPRARPRATTSCERAGVDTGHRRRRPRARLRRRRRRDGARRGRRPRRRDRAVADRHRRAPHVRVVDNGRTKKTVGGARRGAGRGRSGSCSGRATATAGRRAVDGGEPAAARRRLRQRLAGHGRRAASHDEPALDTAARRVDRARHLGGRAARVPRAGAAASPRRRRAGRGPRRGRGLRRHHGSRVAVRTRRGGRVRRGWCRRRRSRGGGRGRGGRALVGGHRARCDRRRGGVAPAVAGAAHRWCVRVRGRGRGVRGGPAAPLRLRVRLLLGRALRRGHRRRVARDAAARCRRLPGARPAAASRPLVTVAPAP